MRAPLKMKSKLLDCPLVVGCSISNEHCLLHASRKERGQIKHYRSTSNPRFHKIVYLIEGSFIMQMFVWS